MTSTAFVFRRCCQFPARQSLLFQPRKTPRSRYSFSSDASSNAATTAKPTIATTTKSKKLNVFLATSVTICIGISAYTRHFRQGKLQEMEFNKFSERDPDELIHLMERNCLMGSKNSVKEELDYIQSWHTQHGYRGGLTLRDLTQRLFVSRDNDFGGGGGKVQKNLHDLEDLIVDPMRLARRECYYLYYEIRGNGEIRQQIFCRGTTLAAEILTCLSFWMVYDDELDCRLHLGFRDHADRILNDILPLLAPPNDKRATVELSGHSLGGAVAFILAAKLRKRGYNVVKVTSIGSPRFCATENGARHFEQMIPKDTIRVDSDADIITYLPPFLHPVGNKLYLIDSTRDLVYIRADNSLSKWTDSFIINFRVPELLLAWGRPHRIPFYISHFTEAMNKSSTSSAKEGGNELTDLKPE